MVRKPCIFLLLLGFPILQSLFTHLTVINILAEYSSTRAVNSDWPINGVEELSIVSISLLQSVSTQPVLCDLYEMPKHQKQNISIWHSGNETRFIPQHLQPHFTHPCSECLCREDVLFFVVVVIVCLNIITIFVQCAPCEVFSCYHVITWSQCNGESFLDEDDLKLKIPISDDFWNGISCSSFLVPSQIISIIWVLCS